MMVQFILYRNQSNARAKHYKFFGEADLKEVEEV
jgi:hypothetical protein